MCLLRWCYYDALPRTPWNDQCVARCHKIHDSRFSTIYIVTLLSSGQESSKPPSLLMVVPCWQLVVENKLTPGVVRSVGVSQEPPGVPFFLSKGNAAVQYHRHSNIGARILLSGEGRGQLPFSQIFLVGPTGPPLVWNNTISITNRWSIMIN